MSATEAKNGRVAWRRTREGDSDADVGCGIPAEKAQVASFEENCVVDRIRYGTTYSLADFCDRLIPEYKPVNKHLLKEVFDGLRRLAAVQNTNAWVTLQATLSAGIWIHYKGRPYCLINPAKNYLRIGASYKNPEASKDLNYAFKDLIASGKITEVQNPDLDQWRFPPEILPQLWEHFEQMSKPEADTKILNNLRHPRTFPGEDRQAALEKFIRDGRICPGVGSTIKAHKIDENDRIEYDHVIPYTKNGASTYYNLAILCVACNRAKGSTAL